MGLEPTIFFAGGGTGGHIFPGLAIAERVGERPVQCNCHFLVSTRSLDAQIMRQHGLPYTPLPVGPLPGRLWNPVAVAGFARAWFAGVNRVQKLIRQIRPAAVVATGGYVSGPAVAAAARAAVPVVMVNLDTPPGRANRWMARRAAKIFTAGAGWPGAEPIGVPLRRSAVGPHDQGLARRALGLDRGRRVLLVTGGSQGANTLNQMMVHLVARPQVRAAFDRWQVLHLVGTHAVEPVRQAYEQAKIPARVQPFCDQMGLAWSAAAFAISRSGAGGVAEAHANATPTLFLPYPFHKDQHQKHNVRALVQIGGAQVHDDLVDPVANADRWADSLAALMGDPLRLKHMTQAMRRDPPNNGAATVADWLIRCLTASQPQRIDAMSRG